jgi:hypothetical protein
MSNFAAVSWREEAIFQWDDDDDVHFVLDQHLVGFSVLSLKTTVCG